MKQRLEIAFVGQGPNQPSWLTSLAKGRAAGYDIDKCIKFSEQVGRRLAITGTCGIFLAEMLGVERLEFLATYSRFNLNARFNGKKGKGDIFDEEEGDKTAVFLLTGPFERYICLGKAVSKCFGLAENGAPLTLWEIQGKRFLYLPHPSKINKWWNDPANRALAKAHLKAFVT